MDSEKTVNTKKWKRAFLYFLAAMLVFAIISRILASINTPKVTIEKMQTRSITHEVKGEGNIENVGCSAMWIMPGVNIENIYVTSGQQVKAGDNLVRLSVDDINKQIEDNNNKKQILNMQIEEKTVAHATAIKRAGEDYTYEEELVSQELALAKKNYDDAVKEQQDFNAIIDNGTVSDEEAMVVFLKLEQARLSYEQSLIDGKKYIIDADRVWEDASEERSRDKEKRKTLMNDDEAQQQVDRAWADFQITSQRQDNGLDMAKVTYSLTIEDMKEKICDNVETAKDNLDAKTLSSTRQMELAGRNVEDSNHSATYDYGLLELKQQLQKVENDLDMLETLKRNDGYVTADSDFYITNILVNGGQKTTEGAAFILADANEGLRVKIEVKSEDASHASVGEYVEVKSETKRDEYAEIIAINKVSEERTEIVVNLSEQTFYIGEHVTVDCTSNNGESYLTIPVEALYRDKAETYIYVIEPKDTVLGEVMVARKVIVEVEDKNDSFVAIKDAGLEYNTEIIVKCEKAISDGMKVRKYE